MQTIVVQVVKAFETHGLRAKQEDWGVVCDSNGIFQAPIDKCICGLGALLIGHSCCDEDGFKIEDPDEAVMAIFGFGPHYVEGFIAGFDGGGGTSFQHAMDDYAKGHADGATCWNELVRMELALIS